jgi:hypothetical protein
VHHPAIGQSDFYWIMGAKPLIAFWHGDRGKSDADPVQTIIDALAVYLKTGQLPPLPEP